MKKLNLNYRKDIKKDYINVDFEKLINNLERFARIKEPECELGINFVVHEKIKDSLLSL